MSTSVTGYKPSLFRFRKYAKYLMYQAEYLSRGDWASLKDSLAYVLFHKLPAKERIGTSAMGKFYLRAHTNDFQFINRTFEIKVKQHVETQLPQLGLFVDIGACIGEYDIWLAKKRIRCIAFEPVNIDAIQRNIDLNKSGNLITLQPFALGAEEGTVVFDILDDVTGYSRKSEDGKGQEITVKKLDDVLPQEDIPKEQLTFIKLDVEGMEVDVLKGAERIIRNTKHLQIAYEYTFAKDHNVRHVLDQHAKFAYKDLDGVNMLATKVA